MNIPIQRRIITRQPYGVLGDVHPFIGRVVAKTIVIQPCFTVFILSLIAERTIIQRASCEGTKFSVDVKLTFRSIKPRNLLIGFRSKNSKRQGIYPYLYTSALKFIAVYLIVMVIAHSLKYYREASPNSISFSNDMQIIFSKSLDSK